MADETTVGAAVIKILFETNAGKILGEISGGVLTSSKEIDELISKTKGFTVVMNDQNKELSGAVNTYRNTSAAIGDTVQNLERARSVAPGTTQSWKALDIAGKEVNITINKQAFEESALTGPLREATRAASEQAEVFRTAAEAARLDAEAKNARRIATESDTAARAAESAAAARQVELTTAEAVSTGRSAELTRLKTDADRAALIATDMRSKATLELATANALETKSIEYSNALNQQQATTLEKIAQTSTQAAGASTQRGAAAQAASAKAAAAEREEEGVMASLKGQIADAKFQLEKAMDPAVIRRLTEEIARLEAQLRGVKFGVISEGLGPVGQMEIKLKALRAELRIATDPTEIKQLSSEIQNLEFAFGKATGKGQQLSMQAMRPIQRDAFAAHQGLFALFFLMNSFDSGKSTGQMKQFKDSMNGALSTAISVSLTLSQFGPQVAALGLPIGIAVGALVALASGFSATGEAAKKAAAEGLKVFSDAVKGLTVPAKIELTVDLKKDLDTTQKALAAAEAKLVEARREAGLQEASTAELRANKETASALKIVEALRQRVAMREGEIDELETATLVEQRLKEIEETSVKLVSEKSSRLVQIGLDLKHLADLQEKGLTVDEHGNSIADQRQKLLKEQHQITATTVELIEKNVKQAEEHYKVISLTAGRFTEQELSQRKQLEQQRTLETNDEKKLELQRRLELIDETRRRRAEEEIVRSRNQYQLTLETAFRATTDDKERLPILEKFKALDTDRITHAQQLYTDHRLTTAEYTEQLRLIIEATRFEEVRARATKELETTLSVSSKFQQESDKRIFEARQSLTKIELDISTKGISDKRDKELAEEEKRHQTVMNNLEKEVAQKAIVPTTDLGELTRQFEIEEGLKRAGQAEDVAHRNAVSAIETSRELEIARIKGEHTRRDRAALDEYYALESRLIETTETDKELREAKIASLERQHRQAIAQMDQRNYNDILSSVDQIGNALARVLGKSANDFAQTIIAGLRAGLEIAKQISAISGKGGEAGFSDIASIAASFISFLAIFQEGGKIGGGPEARMQPAVMAAGEIPDGSFVVNERMSEKHRDVLDALGAKVVTGGEAHKDSVFARTESGLVALTPGERVLPPEHAELGRLINEDKIKRSGAILLEAKQILNEAAMGDMLLKPVKPSAALQAGGPVNTYAAAQTLTRQLVSTLVRERIVERNFISTGAGGNADVIAALERVNKTISELEVKPVIQSVVQIDNLLDTQEIVVRNLPAAVDHLNEKKAS